MDAKPITTEAIAITEKKMDMTLGMLFAWPVFQQNFSSYYTWKSANLLLFFTVLF